MGKVSKIDENVKPQVARQDSSPKSKILSTLFAKVQEEASSNLSENATPKAHYVKGGTQFNQGVYHKQYNRYS